LREQGFVFFGGECVGKSFKEPAQITVRLKVVGFGCLYQGIKSGAGFRSLGFPEKSQFLRPITNGRMAFSA